jgi:hypothetical protein
MAGIRDMGIITEAGIALITIITSIIHMTK